MSTQEVKGLEVKGLEVKGLEVKGLENLIMKITYVVKLEACRFSNS